MSNVFDDLTILEFGGGAAGPVATRYFADHGALVVRVESKQRPDFLRLLKMVPGQAGGLDAAEHFGVLNANKRSVAINLSDPRGVAVAKRLALWADCIAENFAPGAMKKWGLDYASLVQERPDLVMISTCLNGQTGPERSYPGFGGQGSALSGFNQLTGWPDREPVGPYGTITDSLSPRYAAFLLASALWHRTRTGAGQYVDLSQVEGGIVCLSESIVGFTADGLVLERMGNRSRHEAPHGVFRCRDHADGRERWLALAVHDDGDWAVLLEFLGQPAWAMDARFATAAGRLAHVDAIEADLTTWARAQDARDLASRLQAAGIDAAPVNDLGDLHDNGQLLHRGHFRMVDHAVLGRHPAERHAIRFSTTEPALRKAAPLLGEDTEYVLRERLGMTADEYRTLLEAGVLQ